MRFTGPNGMRIAWFAPTPDGRAGFGPQYLEAPGRYNFLQAAIYRLKLSDIPNRPGVELYPTLEVVPGNAKTATFLAHSAVPVTFTEEDFNQVAAGNYLVKVIYLPDPQFQDLADDGHRRGDLVAAGAGRRSDRGGPSPRQHPAGRPAGQHRPGGAEHAGHGRAQPVRPAAAGAAGPRPCRTGRCRTGMTVPPGDATCRPAAVAAAAGPAPLGQAPAAGLPAPSTARPPAPAVPAAPRPRPARRRPPRSRLPFVPPPPPGPADLGGPAVEVSNRRTAGVSRL